MTVISITPWLVAIVGILSAGFATAYPSLDQYSERNHYRIAAESQGSTAPRAPTPTPTPDIDDAAFDKQIAGKWPPALRRVHQNGTAELEFKLSNDNRNLLRKINAAGAETDEQRLPGRRPDSTGGTGAETKINNEKSAGAREFFESNPPQKRSSGSSASSPDEAREEPESISLQELLKLWGIDTSKEPTSRTQRGDIEVKEPESERGDLPASILYSSFRSKRDVGRKLLWDRGGSDIWGFPEDDETLMADQPSLEEQQQQQEEDLGIKRGGGHHKKHHRNDQPWAQERQRQEEERRRQWQEQERRRVDDERRRAEEQRRRDEELRRRGDEDQRQRPGYPNQRQEDPRQRNNVPEATKSARVDDERRKAEELRRRGGVDPRQRHDYPNQRQEDPRERNDVPGATKTARVDDERRSAEEELRRRGDMDPRLRHDYPNQRQEDPRQRYNVPEATKAGRVGDSYEARLRQWQKERDEYYRNREAHQQDPNRGREPPANVRKPNPYDNENEKKLQEYIQRNTPIHVGRPREPVPPRNQYEEQRRRPDSDAYRRQEAERRRYEERDRENENARRAAELERRRQEEEQRRRINDYQRPIPPDEAKARPQQPTARTPVDGQDPRRRWPTARPNGPGWDSEENNRRYQELKKTTGRDNEAERLRTLNGKPVSAQIIIRSAGDNGTSDGTPPALHLRQAVGDEIDFPGISPAKIGLEAPRFPAPPTSRPPMPSPPVCTWAIVVCCKKNKNKDQLGRCFHATDCPGLMWEETACHDAKVRGANEDIRQFYLKGQSRALQGRPINFEA